MVLWSDVTQIATKGALLLTASIVDLLLLGIEDKKAVGPVVGTQSGVII